MLDTKLQSEEYRFYYLFFLALTFLFAMLMPFSYGDLAVWIAEGRQIIQQGTIYIKDAHSFNPTEMTAYPWLSCLLYYFIDANFGIKTIFFLHRLIPVLVVAFWLRRYPALLHKKNWFLLVICISGLSMLIVDRPALLVLPFIPFAYYIFQRNWFVQNKYKTSAFLAIWVNLHGSFLLFLSFFIFRILMLILNRKNITEIKKNIFFFNMFFLVTLINPWSYKIYEYIFQTASISKARLAEWKHLTLFQDQDLSYSTIIFIISLLLTIYFLGRTKKYLTLIFSPILFLILASTFSIRNLPLYFAVLPLYWGENLLTKETILSFVGKYSLRKFMLNRIITILLFFSGILMFSSISENIRGKMPIAYSKYDFTSAFKISEYLSNVTGKKIFNSWILGSHLLYSQQNKIFIDVRNIIYSENTFSNYKKIALNSNGWGEDYLIKQGIDYVVFDNSSPLNRALKVSQNWIFIIEDNGYELFERK